MERTIRVLNDLVRAGLIERYALGGAIAALFYIEPISTYDLDVFIAFPPLHGPIVTLEPIHAYLKQRGYSFDKEHIVIEGVPTRFLMAPSPLVEEATAAAMTKRYGKETVRVMTPEHLLAIMVELNRPKDRMRMSCFLEQAKLNKKLLMGILRRHRLEQKWRKILKDMGHAAT